MDAIRKQASEQGKDISLELSLISEKIQRAQDMSNVWNIVTTARDTAHLWASDVIRDVFEEFTELHGDRFYADDGAITGGIAFLGGKPVTVIASQKGSNLKDTVACNAGMASPEGYRKTLRLARQAEKFARPVITFVDTQGALPGLASEERGIGSSIAMNLRELTHLRVPIVCVVIGEGGSGGALGLCVGDRIHMLENSYFSVITPEAFASLILHDPSRKKTAAAMMKITPRDMLERKFCDSVIPEHEGERPLTQGEICAKIRALLESEIAELATRDIDALIEARNARYFSF